MPRMRLIIVLAVVVGAFAALAPSASASWTNLGGDPLFPGGIQGTGQTARNDFVRKMNTNRAAKAMKRAGLSAAERKAVRNAVNKGRFKQCTLNYGDHFQKMSFGAGTIFVDNNVTFADPNYKDGGAPAFCLTVKVKKKGGKVTTIKLKVPFKCFNIAVVSKKTTKKKGCGCKKPPPPPVPAIPPPGGCTVIINGDNNGNAGCGNIQICTANGSYNNNSTLCNIYMNCVAIQGYTWDSTQNVCVPPPPPPPPPSCEQTNTCPKSVLITSVIDLNDVPAGLNSGPMPLSVYASQAGAQVKVDPGIGKISSCSSSTPLATLTITGLQAGDNDLCVIFYAPTDAAATQATITYTATLTGATPAVRQVTFAITHPTRP